MSTPVSDILQPTDPPSNYPAPVSYVRRMAAWLRSILYTKPATGIPESDLSSGVTDKLNRDVWIHEPEEEGTNGQVLVTDGEGGRSWADSSITIDEYIKKAEVNQQSKTLELTSVGGTSQSVGISALGGVSESGLQNQLKIKADGSALYAQYAQQAYSEGSVVFHDGKLYRCIEAIPSAEEWTTSHWTETTVDTEKATKATTLAGYGITDAKIENGSITLGTITLTPVTDVSGKLDKTDVVSPTSSATAGQAAEAKAVYDNFAGKSTTLAGYGITDAKISNGTITLGTSTITPITDISGKVSTSDIVNDADTPQETTGKVLDARMGKTLNDKITSLSNRGRYLSLWDCSTGLAKTNPDVSPYTYKSGDYFIVGAIASGTANNYRPSGDKYVTGSASTVVESDTVHPNDTYCYDGSSWTLLKSPSAVVSFANLSGSPSDNDALASALGSKLNTSDVVAPSSSATTGKAADAKSVYDNFAGKATTIAGYGITDAKIENGTITIGADTITPVTDVSGKLDKTDVVAPSSSATTGKAADAKSVYDNFSPKATTLSGYGITDAKIENGAITLGSSTITPVTDVSGKVDKSGELPTLGDDPTEDEMIAALKALRTLCSTT